MAGLTDRLETRKVVERAKGLLMIGIAHRTRRSAGFSATRWTAGPR